MTNDDALRSGHRILQMRRDAAVILRPEGVLDDEVADDLRMLALEAHAPVIIDLDGCVHIEGSAVRSLTDGWALYRPELCFACGPVGDRRMLQSADVAEPLPVFSDVDEALATCSSTGRFRAPDGAPTGHPRVRSVA